MHLKRIELQGFKSFADKTVLDFPGGIVSIVGPNGSGKSNVIDAIRWILGEREAKNLRGGKAEDLIFAGTPKRSRMGMAQVTIVFDNSSGFFQVDFKEVAITRRIERDGNSEYFLNGAEVRLKDIIDFFAKARLGTRGLSIINQGSSDLFVRATPEERRAMIEEILGLRQYQLKKHEAERKLKNTGVNIEKVRAMLEEIAPHLRFLKRQTSKWEKLGDIQKELGELENVYFGNKLKDIESGKNRLDPEIKKLDEEIAGKQKELALAKKDLEKVEDQQPEQKGKTVELRKKRDALFEERAKLEREASKLEAKIEFLHSLSATQKTDFRSGELLALLLEVKEILAKLLKERNLEPILPELERLFGRIQETTESSNQNSGEAEDLKKVKADLLKKIPPISAEIQKLALEEEELSKGFEIFNIEFRKVFERVEKKKEEILAIESSKNKLLFELERFNLRKQDMELQISQTGRSLKDFLEHSRNPAPVEDIVVLERKMLKFRAEIAGIGDVDQALVKEAQDTEGRHNFLSGQLADLEKAVQDLNGLINELEEKIDNGFQESFKKINSEFDKFFNLMFGGGKAKMFLEKPDTSLLEDLNTEGVEIDSIQQSSKGEGEDELSKQLGVEIDVSLPRKKVRGLEMLSGGEKSLVSIAALFALIAVSPPPFLVLDEVDAALDEKNTKRFADIVQEFSKKTQFVIVTHNRSTMEAASVLYGVTMEGDGVSKILSIKLD